MENITDSISIQLIVEIAFYVILALLYGISSGKKITTETLLSLMLRVEKDADDLLLENGDDKFHYVVEKGYQLLPRPVRLLINVRTFERIAATLYVQAKRYVLQVEENDFVNKIKTNIPQ